MSPFIKSWLLNLFILKVSIYFPHNFNIGFDCRYALLRQDLGCWLYAPASGGRMPVYTSVPESLLLLGVLSKLWLQALRDGGANKRQIAAMYPQF